MGVYGLSQADARRGTAPGRPLGFDDLVLDLLARGSRLRRIRFDGYWLDIGRPEDYDRANAEFDAIRHTFLPE